MRGLKFQALVQIRDAVGRTPQGVRGLKFRQHHPRLAAVARRTPQGVRGLKYVPARPHVLDHPVAPRKGCVD